MRARSHTTAMWRFEWDKSMSRGGNRPVAPEPLLSASKAAVTWPNPICRRFVSNKYLFVWGRRNWNIQCFFLCLNGLLGTSVEFISSPFRLQFFSRGSPINCYLEKVRWGRRWAWIKKNLCLVIKFCVGRNCCFEKTIAPHKDLSKKLGNVNKPLFIITSMLEKIVLQS